MSFINRKQMVLEVVADAAESVAGMYRHDPKRSADVSKAFELLLEQLGETFVHDLNTKFSELRIDL